MDDKNKFCNICGSEFDVDDTCVRATLKNQRFMATLDETGSVIQEACEDCQQEIYEGIEPLRQF